MLKQNWSSCTLKCFAITFMLIDHMGAVLFPQYEIFRYIGRLAFPIFCFLIVEGFYHTHNPILYMSRLVLFAIISELPFDWMITIINGRKNLWAYQNVYFTLFFGLFMIYCLNKIEEKWKDRYELSVLLQVLSVVATIILAEQCNTDYGGLGILYILIFYLLRGRNGLIAICLFVLTVYLHGGVSSQAYAVLALLIINRYSGEKGASMKYFFYLFYPVHITILCFLHTCLF